MAIFLLYPAIFSIGKSVFPLCLWLSTSQISLFLCSIIPLAFLLLLYLPTNSSSVVKEPLLPCLYFLVCILLVGCFQSNSPFLFLFFFESCVFFMLYVLMNFSKNEDKLSSIFFMFLFNILGSILFMIFICFSPPLINNYLHLSSPNPLFFSMFILILCSKLPIFFFHFWLTKAHVSALGSGSMILASLLLKIGSFGIFKFAPLFSSFSSSMFSLSPSFLIFSSILFCMFMTRFSDVKYLVANSSVLHMSYSSFLISSLCPIGICSSMFVMVGHGLVSLVLFFLVTEFYESSYSRSMDLNKSTQSSSFLLFFSVFMFFLFNLGLPPFINFFSEVLIFSFFYSLAPLFSSLFCLVLQFSVLPFFAVLLGLSFGKKSIFSLGGNSFFTMSWSFFFSIFLFLSPLLWA